MIARLRALWLNVNASYWFFPSLFSIIAVALAFATVWLDNHGAADWLSKFAWLNPARPEGASNILTVIAGSMIGVASTVFSITIAAVAYASGNYGPRLLTNFMEDKGNQLSLGVFIATFVYAVMVLRVVRAEDEQALTLLDAAATGAPGFVPQLSLLVATGLMALSVAVLVYFLNHIPSSIRINTVLQGIGERLIRGIEARFPEGDNGTEPTKMPHGEPVGARGAGYVQIIDFDSLEDVAKDHKVRLALAIRTGDFVHEGMTLVEIIDGTSDEGLVEAIYECFSLGGMRTATQDLEFLIDELVEIALRALSPGINDPFTAITALHWLAAATAQIAKRNLERDPDQDDEEERRRLRPLPDDFEHFLSRGFGGIRASAAASALTSRQMLDSLANVALSTRSQHRRDAVYREGQALREQARLDMAGPSLHEFEADYAEFVARMETMAV